jgi:hypothetical protein
MGRGFMTMAALWETERPELGPRRPRDDRKSCASRPRWSWGYDPSYDLTYDPAQVSGGFTRRLYLCAGSVVQAGLHTTRSPVP